MADALVTVTVWPEGDKVWGEVRRDGVIVWRRFSSNYGPGAVEMMRRIAGHHAR